MTVPALMNVNAATYTWTQPIDGMSASGGYLRVVFGIERGEFASAQ
jgi:hypothetical protein